MSDLPGSLNNRGWWFEKFLPLYNGREGDIAEFGVFNGGSTRELAKYARRVWAFDTFQGLPSEDYTHECDNGNEPGKFTPEIDVLETFKSTPNVIPMVGRFIDTFPLVPKDVKFIACFIDPDYYESHWQVFRWLPDHLLPGAILMFDDYDGLSGAKKAIDEFCEQEKLELMENHFVMWHLDKEKV